MKKLSFILAMVLGTGMAMAQTHISTVIETGDNQEAEITQTGPGDITSNVNQSNAINFAKVMQINPGLALSNDILSDVFQSGIHNTATVTQNHNGTAGPLGLIKALVNQSGNENEAIQKQGPHGQLGSNYVEIMQSGHWNNASQNQLKYGNDARINQSGIGNTAMQAQDAAAAYIDDFEGSMNTALINQSGDGNWSEQSQDGWANDVQAYQSGDNNTSKQTQKYDSWKSIAFVNQLGNSNEATQDQIGRLNNAKISQYSSGNEAIQTQTSVGTRPNAVYFPLNEAEIIQLGGDGNIARQTQTTATGEFANATDANYGYIRQDGGLNEAYQTQAGGFNYGSVNQTGNGHLATVNQNQSLVQP